MAASHVRVTIDAGIATVMMDRAPVNAIDSGFMREIGGVFDALGDHPEVRVVILTGRERIFCAGADLKETVTLAASSAVRARYHNEHRSFITTIRECCRPVIAAINGPAIGTGVGILAACDILIASENAWLSMPEVVAGMPSGAATLHRLFGHSKGRRLFYSGARIDAAELYRLGVIEACVSPDRLMAEARVIASEIATQSAGVLRAAKQCYNLAEDAPFAVAKSLEYGLTAQFAETTESRVAMEAHSDLYTDRTRRDAS